MIAIIIVIMTTYSYIIARYLLHVFLTYNPITSVSSKKYIQRPRGLPPHPQYWRRGLWEQRDCIRTIRHRRNRILHQPVLRRKGQSLQTSVSLNNSARFCLDIRPPQSKQWISLTPSSWKSCKSIREKKAASFLSAHLSPLLSLP